MRTPGLKACLLRVLGDITNEKGNKLYCNILCNIIYGYENRVNYYSHYYNTFFITCCPKNTVYRYTVYNEKTRLWPFYKHFAERKKGISNNSVIT